MSVEALKKSNEVSSNSIVKDSVLALQHLIAMFGATVLVPILTGFDPGVALLAAGCGTLIFHICTNRKVPVFLGSSFAFIPVIIAVREAYGDLAFAQGGIIVAGLVYVLLSFIMGKVKMETLEKVLPAQVVGPMIMVIGLNLIPVAKGMASMNYWLAGITLAVALVITFMGKGFIKQLAISIAVLAGYSIAFFTGHVDTAVIADASLLSMPSVTMPKFDIGAIMMIVPVVLAVFMEHIGDITTNGAVVGKDFIKDPGLKRTLLGDGLATIFAGLIGGPANTTYGENTGVLAITKNYDPKVLRLAAVFAIALSIIGKVGAVLKSIPVPVMGGISLMLFSMIALIGVKTIKNNKVEFNAKNIIVMATILILGFGGGYIENATGVTVGITITETVKFTGLSFAAIVGVLLNLALELVFNRD